MRYREADVVETGGARESERIQFAALRHFMKFLNAFTEPDPEYV